MFVEVELPPARASGAMPARGATAGGAAGAAGAVGARAGTALASPSLVVAVRKSAMRESVTRR
ncbi:hypothetical protein [Burkholderia glumae]|uniref:hypothetical protein n=1 Tax=Burkholderia glumae TaxID=337 RepID=UPI00265EB654|nr:hypothetical protein [Burkholderia glumae]